MRDPSSPHPLRPRPPPQQADVASIAEHATNRLEEIEAALSPIIGPRAVVALYERSLHITARSHAWLNTTNPGDTSAATLELETLRTLMNQQSAEAAQAAATELLEGFFELVASLVGISLTRQLLPLTSPAQEDPK